MQPLRKLGAGLTMIALAACNTNQSHEKLVTVKPETLSAYLEDKPTPVHPFYARVLMEGERNLVLNHMRAGLAAMQLGEFEAAAASFDEALQRIEAIYANTEKAEQARSLWVKENVKDFKGEPYERAMVYFYRGLLYLMEGDYENARASFKGGMLQDTLAEAEQYRADFAALAFLEGWASHCAGAASLARESFAEAQTLRPELLPPAEDHDLLLVAESGSSPTKLAGGERRERLEFARGRSSIDTPANFVLQPAGASEFAVSTVLAEDLYWQATTRGGRQVDAILDGKAQFKDTTEAVGDVALAAGLGVMATHNYSGNDNAAAAGAIIILAGLIAKAAAEAMRPEADTRYWDNLPDALHIATARQPATSFEAAATFGAGQSPAIVVRPGRCAIAWARSEPATAIPESAPGAVAPGEDISYRALLARSKEAAATPAPTAPQTSTLATPVKQ